jgi:hypothetical protein
MATKISAPIVLPEPDDEEPAVGAGAHAPLQHGQESGRHVGGDKRHPRHEDQHERHTEYQTH